MKRSLALLALLAVAAAANPAPRQNGCSLYLLTTPEGANLPAGVSLENFPILVRLTRQTFPFAQAQPHGEDVRITDRAGQPLAFQIEHWDATKGEASVWVRVPKIEGNTRQELKLHWGDPKAQSASNGAAVFNESNGYVGVWHLDESLADSVGVLLLKNAKTTSTPGAIGPARHLAGEQGLAGGEALTSLPTGSAPHSSQAWFRAEKPNGTLFGWGNEQRQGKVVMQYRSPAHINLDCYFSDANVASAGKLPVGEWVHVVHTYERGKTRLYVNGALAGSNNSTESPLNLQSPAKLWIGGWYNNYSYVGDIDEVRLSRVARSADWVRLEYENQKPLQTLVGLPVQPGTTLSVSPATLTVREGDTATVTAQAGGAQKLYWLLDGQVVATDQLTYTLAAGRVRGNQKRVLQLKAVYADGVRTKTLPITIQEALPDPTVALKAPRRWDGRTPIELTATAKAPGTLRYQWQVSGLATTREVLPGKLRLTRAQNSGTLTVRVAVDNGGTPTVQTVQIHVTEPQKDPWVERVPAAEEHPIDNQFYARNEKKEGLLYERGTLDSPAEEVFLRVFMDNMPIVSLTQKLGPKRTYAFTVPLEAGLVHYRTEFGTKTAGQERIVRTATNLVCGDAFIIQGQSNAVSTDFGKDTPAFESEWIRTYSTRWSNARYRNDPAEIGYWGMELARQLVEFQHVPVCILNGAVGGTRIDQHQRNNANPTDPNTIYGRLLQRVQAAKLTHGIRGLFWHQGENDQGADGPTGGFGWETYQAYFIDLTAAWKQDFPNLAHYWAFQIWPKSCSMGIDGSDNRLREEQRRLPALFSNLGLMSTLGIDPPGGCHFPAAGYAEFARLIFPLVARDRYGRTSSTSITPPNLTKLTWATAAHDTLVLEFDQPVLWSASLASEFLLDGVRGKVASGQMAGNRLTLTLTGPSTARTLTYLDSASWSQARLLRGANGIAAFTFCDVPIQKTP